MIRIILGVAPAMLSIHPSFAKEDLRGISLDMSRGRVESQLSQQCDQLPCVSCRTTARGARHLPSPTTDQAFRRRSSSASSTASIAGLERARG